MQANVRLGDIMFAQDDISKLVRGGWEDETVYQIVRELLGMDIRTRRATIAARFDQLRVVPIRRHADATGDDATRTLMVSLDNRRLLIMRATLPADEIIPIRVATGRERNRELNDKWTSQNQGYTIKIRGKGGQIGKSSYFSVFRSSQSIYLSPNDDLDPYKPEKEL